MGISVFPVPASGISTSDLITQPEWVRLASTSTSPGSGTLTISNIPSTYKTLKIGFYGITGTEGQPFLGVRFNSDSGARYNYHIELLRSTTTGQLGDTYQNATNIRVNYDSLDQPQRISGELTVQNYSSSTAVEKYFESWSAYYAYSGNYQSLKLAGMYIPTSAAAITSVSLFLNVGNLDINTAPAGVYVLGAK